MSCYYPMLAVDLGLFDGKHKIKFLPSRVDYNISRLREKYGDDLLLLPCGSCPGCKVDKSKDWAVRGVLEASQHATNSFLTLTYDDEHLPKTQKENRSNIKSFIRRLRDIGVKVRYLGCGERGSLTNRIHGHLICFGWHPLFSMIDCQFWSLGKDGDRLFHSDYLDSLWMNGRVLFGDCSFQSIAYVARYTTKKIGDNQDSFLIWSNRPGLGRQYFDANKEKIAEHGFVYGDFGSQNFAPCPRSFKQVMKEEYPDLFEKYKKYQIFKGKVLFNKLCQKYGDVIPENIYIQQSGELDPVLTKLERGDM